MAPVWEGVREVFLEEGTSKLALEDKEAHSREVKESSL